MLSRVVRVQVALFGVLAIGGTAYVGASYAGLDKLFLDRGYTVVAQFPSGGGIFSNAEVTYRGVPVGRVGDLRLTAGGMEADLNLDSGTPAVPADTQAVVADRSAVGEQYVDLRPRTDGGPDLHDGSVITEKDTEIPLRVDTVLATTDSFVESVPKPALRTVVDELYDATSGAGPALDDLVGKGIEFVETASAHVEPLTNLVTDATTVLETQVQQADAIRSFGTNAAQVAAALKQADGDVRALIPVVPDAVNEVNTLIRDSGPRLGVLLANLLTTSQVLESRQDGVRQLLVTAPKAVQAASSVIRPDGAHVGLALNFFDPLPCTTGYTTTYRNGLDTSTRPLNTSAECALPKGDPTNVRGSQNAPGGR
ncbi:MCE family protein [Amycolatopsis jiangsuensis]|uniref:Phospholipid/cholesterol/gamma-HCH transport system substrate-binding protein n=1 Tax=Amycolatopsis jiangsuensis TaxID=1181879 RepID=A0A840J0T6_9PSEU|nr:MlaD family protein [Amycolatopsis jiangsuensis]MBB4688711.1 phospholipid/cholesterol/gamma-HCH transport system substrate-binding protein [Amycolatopsis jiangsuensis]